MTAAEWVDHLRLASRCTIAELTPAQCGELAEILEVALNQPSKEKRNGKTKRP